MPFDWMRAVEKNRDDLIEIVTRLFLLAGIRTFVRVTTLPRSRHLSILSILRPAEFAARRLIAMAACHLVVTRRPAERRGPQSPNAVILGFNPRTHSVKPEPAAKDEEINADLHLRGFGEVRGMDPRLEAEDDGVVETSRPTGKTKPATPAPHKAIPTFALFDPIKPYGSPWLEEGADDTATDWPQFVLPPDEPVDARPVCRRILALEAALQDLEGQARRLARWRARRAAESSSCSGLTRVRPKRWQPMRPGRPPGLRRRPKTAVEEVLKECHSLALYAWRAPDTS